MSAYKDEAKYPIIKPKLVTNELSEMLSALSSEIEQDEQVTENGLQFGIEGWREKLNSWSRETRFSDKPKPTAKKTTYSFEEIPNLFSVVKEMKDDQEKNRARFVLIATPRISIENLIFAYEGGPTQNNNIHSHGTLSNRQLVYAAGTVYFDEQGKINMIDHKSGDFRFGFSSLSPVLHLLSQPQNRRRLADTLTIFELDNYGTRMATTTVNTSDWQQLQMPAQTSRENSPKRKFSGDGASLTQFQQNSPTNGSSFAARDNKQSKTNSALADVVSFWAKQKNSLDAHTPKAMPPTPAKQRPANGVRR